MDHSNSSSTISGLPEAQPWHALTVAELAKLLDVDLHLGLTAQQIEERRRRFGLNRPTPPPPCPTWKRFVRQITVPLQLVLMIAAVMAFLIADVSDAIVILTVVLVNAVIGVVQENRAERAVAALDRLTPMLSVVLRQGVVSALSTDELVPGDVVLLAAGDRIPADMRLLECNRMSVDESMLTGESIPSFKQTDAVAATSGITDRSNMAYGGTFVAQGVGKGIVVGTGDRSEVGRIAKLIASASDTVAPLTIQTQRLGRQVLGWTAVLAISIFAAGLWRGQSILEILLVSISAFVAVVPEGLPAALTITLAIGMHRMAKRRAIVKSLPAAETLGSCTVICSDKTGTLTTNRMTVAKVWAPGLPAAIALERLTPGDLGDALIPLFEACLLSRESETIPEDPFSAPGDPTEIALVVAADDLGFSADRKVLDLLPFDPSRGLMAALLEAHGNRLLVAKGSVEKMLRACNHPQNERAGSQDWGLVQKMADELAAAGYRVIALAHGHTEIQEISETALTRHLSFAGLAALQDPPRPGVAEAIRVCRGAGIRVKMITGDHPLTALAIARQLELVPEGENQSLVVLGADLEAMTDAECAKAAKEVHIFARSSPEQKFRLVECLQREGECVAMTGDGVNDAPALRQADVGVAMGFRGTDVARQAGDMILTDDCFSTIVAAIREGRGIIDNLRKFLVWTIPTNTSEGLSMLVALLAGLPIPLLPIQLLWINLSTAIFQGIGLIFEPVEPNVMQRGPRTAREPLWSAELIQRTLFVSFLILAGAFWQFLQIWDGTDASLASARTAVMNTIIFAEGTYLLACRNFKQPFWTVSIADNPLVIVGIAISLSLQVAMVYIPWMTAAFRVGPLTLGDWLTTTLIALAILGLAEIEKQLRSLWWRRKIRRSMKQKK
jgi:cation-transporting ATPase F